MAGASDVATVIFFCADLYRARTFLLTLADFLERGAFLRPDTLANTNKMEIFVFSNDETEQVVLSARLDNLVSVLYCIVLYCSAVQCSECFAND